MEVCAAALPVFAKSSTMATAAMGSPPDASCSSPRLLRAGARSTGTSRCPWRPGCAGEPAEPGTQLFTVDGTVVEVPTGTRLSSLLDLSDLQAVLVGGYFGTWLPAHDVSLTHRDLRAVGGALGAGVVIGLPVGFVKTSTVRALRLWPKPSS